MARALAFDAVGTLLFPDPPAAEIYAAVGARCGSRLTPAEIAPRFRAAFARQEQLDVVTGLRTDEAREQRRWRDIVAEVLDDVDAPDACFQVLYAHFASPKAWRLNPEALPALAAARRRGQRLALASNYDARLHPVAAALLPMIGEVVISSEVGWRKPAPEFFAALCERLEVPPHEVVLVGDDHVNDFDGAVAAGLQAILYDPRGRLVDLGARRIGDLGQIGSRVQSL
jgi:putative hydrolase of the HAD superfamily